MRIDVQLRLRSCFDSTTGWEGSEIVRAEGRAKIGPANAVQSVSRMSQRNSMAKCSVAWIRFQRTVHSECQSTSKGDSQSAKKHPRPGVGTRVGGRRMGDD